VGRKRREHIDRSESREEEAWKEKTVKQIIERQRCRTREAESEAKRLEGEEGGAPSNSSARRTDDGKAGISLI
jgi:hypothetical protein